MPSSRTLVPGSGDGSFEGPGLALRPLLFYIRGAMQNRTDTLEVGSRAPQFSLAAANREGIFSLSGLTAGGTLVLEFLRGTW